MNTINQKYKSECDTKSDINQHLPTLKKYTEECDHVTEMGVRGIVSTWAFLAGVPKKLISYDIYNPSNWGGNIQAVYESVEDTDIEFEFREEDVLKVEIEETDFLFIDTLHQYKQLSQELKLHADKAKKYIGFHDTTKYETLDEMTGNWGGLWRAIEEFLEENPHWRVKERFTNNNGLTIIERI